MRKPDPLALDQDADLPGHWWLPDSEDEPVFGYLTYRPDRGPEISLHGTHAYMRFSHGASRLHGVTDDGRPVTLLNLSPTKTTISTPGSGHVKARVDVAFVGLHGENDPRLLSLAARIEGLTSWLAPPALRWPPRGADGWSSMTDLGRAPGGLRLEAWVQVSAEAESRLRPQRLHVRQDGWVRIRPGQAKRTRPWETLDFTLRAFRQLISLMAAADVAILEIKAEAMVTDQEWGRRRPRSTRKPVWVLFNRTGANSPVHLPSEHLLFRAADTDFSKRLPLGRWFRRAGDLDLIVASYVAALLPTGQGFLEPRFLTFAQTLEAYYFRRRSGPGHRKFADALTSSIERIPAALRAEIPTGFVASARDTRNFLTHFNPRYTALQGNDLDAATRSLRLLFELNVLRDLGFGQRQIGTLIENNQRLTDDVQLGFMSLPR